MRLDKFIASNFNLSRDAAIELIKAGGVTVNGQIIDKPATKTDPETLIEIDQQKICPYVSRAGLKLEQALKEFDINPYGQYCLDIGSSTGGFTHCLLKNGAEHVVCVDVGTNQLHSKLRADKRITLYEQTDIRDFNPELLLSAPSLITIDVSFISSLKVLPAVTNIVNNAARVIVLIKPQYERDFERGDFLDQAKDIGFKCLDFRKTKQKGKGGTQEYIANFRFLP